MPLPAKIGQDVHPLRQQIQADGTLQRRILLQGQHEVLQAIGDMSPLRFDQ